MELNHFDKNGNAVMVDVSDKPVTHRTATATGSIQVSPEIMDAVKSGNVKKGDVLGVIGAVGSGSSVVSCQFQIDIPPFQQLGVGERSSGAAGSAAVLRQIIPSRI